MKECKFYERNEADFQEHLSYMRASAATEGIAGYEPDEESEFICDNFCKYLVMQNGFPGETLWCCNHPENRRIVYDDSVFDGADPEEINKILDAVC